MGLPYLLARKVGSGRASILLMANLAISGPEAERFGLIERCVQAGTVFDEALKMARYVAASEPGTVRKLKRHLGLQRAELKAELELNAAQQAKDFQTEEYRRRVEHYLPNHYD
jgi:2-(1,2-epoxy-1,2-dihydrophenyl)acetyl-CoA isomerase